MSPYDDHEDKPEKRRPSGPPIGSPTSFMDGLNRKQRRAMMARLRKLAKQARKSAR